MSNPFNLSSAAQSLYDDYLAKKKIRLDDDGSLATENSGLVQDQAAVAAAQQKVVTRQAGIALLTAKDNAELLAENAAQGALITQLIADLNATAPGASPNPTTAPTV